MERPTPRQVTDWLIELAKLVAPGRNAELGEAIRACTPHLVERFISRDFNAASRAWVAERCKFWPSYGELCEHLDKWPRPAEKPATSQPAVDDERLTDEDRMCIAWWNKRVAEGASQAKLDSLASLIRARSSRAWEHIRQPEPDKPTATVVSRSLASLRGHPMRQLLTGMLISSLLANAPDLLQLVEEDALGEAGIGLPILRALYQARASDKEADTIFRETASYRLSRLPSVLPTARQTEPPSAEQAAPPPPFRDVTLTGDALRKSRAARGCSVPVPEHVPEPWPEHEEALF